MSQDNFSYLYNITFYVYTVCMNNFVIADLLFTIHLDNSNMAALFNFLSWLGPVLYLLKTSLEVK